MSDTIAAIATPQLPSAIGILRLSGPGTLAALDRVFRARNRRTAGAQTPRRMVYGDLLDADGSVIDNVLCVRFPGPDSYTGEDCAELHCHGSPVVLNAGLAALFAAFPPAEEPFALPPPALPEGALPRISIFTFSNTEIVVR